MNFKNKIIYIFFSIFLWIGMLAQNYPVQVFLQVSPPHTSYLPDYANPANEQLKVFITLTDLTVPAYNVKLRFKFQGNGYLIENPTYLNLPPITINPGVPFELSGAALAGYLNTQNLVFSGVNAQDYENRKVLPEGPCSVCVELYDYNSSNNTPLSNPACTNVWFSMYDPPYLNTPFCNSEVIPTTPQQVVFSWTPLNMNSPFSGNTSEYVFELFEKRPVTADPNVVVNSTLPIFMQVTNQPFVNYGITEPQLQVGKEYIWRVQVRDNSGRDYFKNNGYSQVCEFTYGNLASQLFDGVEFNLQANGTGVRQGYAWWDPNGLFNNYVLEVRKTGNTENRWFPYPASNPNTKVNSLEPETEYECRVRGVVNTDSSEWSDIEEFTTQPVTEYACGTTMLPATDNNIVPYMNAIKGMVFTIGQFDMMTTSLTPLSTDGHYKGTGKITIPFMLTNLNVSFDDILVDDNLVVRTGKVEAISKGIDAWELEIEIDKAKLNPSQVEGTIDSVYMRSDSTFLVQFGGQQLIIDSIPAAVYDSDGNAYYILADGTVEYRFIGSISEDELAASDTLHVNFKHYNQQNYGFDAFDNGLWPESYETIELNDDYKYRVPYKSILANGTDKVLAIVHAKNGETLDGLTFNCLDGRLLSHTALNDSTFEIDLDGFYAEEEAVYAMWNGGKMGKLNIRAYDSLIKEVVIVPVNGATVGTQGSIQSLLNQTYKQALVNWTVTVDSNFLNTTWDANNNGTLENSDATLMSKYSSEMKALRDAYLDVHPDFDKSKSLLFVVPNFENTSTLGYMVRGKGVGFLASSPEVKTIAHELGHGAFGLYHTFPAPPKSSTNNLLDYSNNGKLNKYQWEKIHNWSPTLSFLDDEEDGTLAIEYVDEFGRKSYAWYPLSNTPSDLDDIGAFYTPSGKIIYLNNSNLLDKYSIVFDVLTGGVVKFKYDNKNYFSLFTKSSTTIKFYGYSSVNYFYDLRDVSGNTDIPLDVYKQAQFLQGSNDSYFFDFTNTGTKKVVGMLTDIADNCNKTVIKWEGTGSISAYEIFSTDNIYAAPLNTTLQALTESDFTPENTYDAIDNDVLSFASPAMKTAMCKLINLYSLENSLERMYLEKSIISNGYNNIYQFLEKDLVEVVTILDIANEYKDLSDELKKEYDYRLTTNQSNNFIVEIFEKSSTTRSESNTEYLARLRSLKQKWKNDVTKITVTTDEDYITQLLCQHSDAELKTLTKDLIVKCLGVLTKDWMFNGEETIANRLLVAASTKTSSEATFILSKLIEEREIRSSMGGSNVQHNSILEALYDRINGDGNNEFVRGLYLLWLASDHYTNIENPLYNYNNLKEATYNYQSTSTLGFYNSNYNFYSNNPENILSDSYLHYVYIREEGEQVVDRYHILQPIGILNISQEGVVKIPHNIIPAFLLYAFDKMNGNANAVLGAEVAFDVLSVAVGGVGLISKLRYLGKLSQLSRAQQGLMFIKGIEFTVGTANTILNYSCDNSNTRCKEVQNVLMLIELFTLSSDALLESIVKTKVKHILDNDLIPSGTANRQELEGVFRQIINKVNTPPISTSLKQKVAASGINLTNTSFITGDGDGFFDIIIHSNNSGQFLLKAEGQVEVVLEAENLAQLIKSRQTNKPVRLLSCNTDAAAIELSTALGSDVSFYASHGYVDITTNGVVTSQNKFIKYNDGTKIDSDYLPLNPANAPPPTSNSNRIRLGLAEGVDDAFNSIQSIQNLRNIPGISLKQLDNIGLIELQNLKSTNNIGQFVNVSKAEIITMNKPLNKSSFYSHSGFDNFQSKIPNGSPSVNQNIKIFNTKKTPPSPLLRHNDAEVKIFEDIASQLGAKKGDVGTKVFSDVNGKIKIKTELCPCGSCSGVIEQFKIMFPRVELEILAQPKISF